MEQAENSKPPLFRRRKPIQAGRSTRKVQQSHSDSDSSSAGESSVVRTELKSKRLNPNIHRTTLLKRKQQTLNASDSGDEKDDEIVSIRFKSQKTALPVGPCDQGATSIVEFDTEKKDETSCPDVNTPATGGVDDDKIYRGLSHYAKGVEKKEAAAGNAPTGMLRKGPLRAPDNLRATVRWDYQPDICKDYKETGYCGFGDSCKFLHDRSDYKAGWQLEMDSVDNEEDENKYKIESDEEELPFKCLICRDSFVDPVVTKCKHYFCEKCVLKNYRKTARCFVCGLQTNGVFNPAKALMAKLKMDEKSHECDEAADDDNESSD